MPTNLINDVQEFLMKNYLPLFAVAVAAVFCYASLIYKDMDK